MIQYKKRHKYKYMGHYVGKDYYDFRIYKGYNMGEDTLVFQQKVESRRGLLDVETALFENGETYTWSVRHVVNATKSDRGYKSFTVKK